jgi:CRISPR-associated protein Cas2
VTVIIANDTPDAIRGMLKRWFIEPRPNVFIGTVNRRVREKTLEYIKRNAAGLGMLIISDDNSCQGFKIETFGETNRKGVEISGLWLAAEDWVEQENRPF